MHKANLKFVLYLIALVIILAEPGFALHVGAIWALAAIYSKLKNKPIIVWKIKKK